MSVQAAVERAALEVVERLAGMGLPPRRKPSPQPTSPWWEQPAEVRT